MIWCKHERIRVRQRGRTGFRAFCRDCRIHGKVTDTREKAIISLRQEPQWFL